MRSKVKSNIPAILRILDGGVGNKNLEGRGGAAGGEKLKITNGNVEESQFHSRKSVKGKFSPP